MAADLRILAHRALRFARRLRSPLMPTPPQWEALKGFDDRNPILHPERLAVLPYAKLGRCLEVGCGHRKTTSHSIAIDLSPGGQRGSVGNARGRISAADIAANGGHLPIRSASFDVVIARHNLEHYVDTLATLVEWCRVVRIGGTVAVVVPDEERFEGRTVDLDPTHYHSFSERSLRNLFEAVPGLMVETTSPVILGWSFLLVAKRRR